MNNLLRNCAIGLLYVAAFIPLYVDNSLFFPFITGKAFAFRIIVEIVVALWLVLVLRDRKYAPKFTWLSVSVFAFVVWILITDLAGLNAIRSLWSNFERMEGWVTLAHLWLFFLAAASLFGNGEEGRRMWHRYLRVGLVAAFMVGIYGVVQLAGGAAIHQGSWRIDASLGNAAYMAVYMLGSAFIAFYLALVEWSRNAKGMTWFYFILGAFFSFLLFETATRGTILGLVGGLLLALGLYVVFGKGESKKLRTWSGAIILVIVLLGVGIVAGKNTSFVKNNEILNRLATISWKESQGQARGYIWPMAIKGVFESPKTMLLGVGQENFNYIFNAKYVPQMWSQEQWFDRAHSVYLDWLVAGGLIGLLLYLSFFVLGIRLIWKSSLTFAEKCLVTGFYVGYGIHNVFVFDNIASYMLFFTLLGFSHSLAEERPIRVLEVSDQPTENQVVVRDYIYVPLVVLLAVIALYFVNIRAIQANKTLIKALTSCSGGSVPDAKLYEKALKYNQSMANQEIREQLLACSGNVMVSGLPQETKLAFYTLTTKEITSLIASAPGDARGYTLAGVFFNNIDDAKNATPFLEKALQLSPEKQSIMFELAQNYVNIGKTKEALDLLRQAYESAPENENAKIAYITGLIFNGDEAKARELAGGVEALNDEKYVSAFARAKQYDRVITIMKALIAKDPTNFQYHLNLAAAYYENKQISLTLSQLELMKEKFPIQKEQLEAAIAQVKAGN
jgi:O-antigen ligase